MGGASSKIEEDKALQLCRERKKFVRQALDGRCSLAAAHVAYVQSLRTTGTALRKFVEPEGPVESSLYTSTSATPEMLALTEKSLSQFSFSSPTVSQHVDATETISPSPSTPTSSQFQANHMRFRGISSKTVEEKPPSPFIGTITSSSTPQNRTPRYTEKPDSSPLEDSAIPPAWDFFGINPIDHQFSVQKGSGVNQELENDDYIRRLKEAEGIPDLENVDDDASFHAREDSQDSEDGFDEPSTDTLVRKFENFNRKQDHNASSASPVMPSVGSVASESEFISGEKSNSPNLSPVRATFSRSAPPNDTKETPVKEDRIGNKVTPKDFFSSMKDVELLFIKASECGKEVPRMLEANKLHFRPMFPAKQSGSMASTFFKACFSCGEEHIQVQEEPAQTPVKYLTWHRTESSRSSSSRNPLGLNSKDDVEDLANNVFDSICMISGSHASTLDRLYAWERKLYDEVKASGLIRRKYDSKCKILRQLESKGESNTKIDKTRAVVKDLHSRIKVAIHRIATISKRIEELRDTELQPQLEELIEGLHRMWELMFECHKLQFDVISVAYNNGNGKISIQSDSHRQITIHLENELNSLSSNFTKWIESQTFYLEAINNWLLKGVAFPQKHSKRKRRPNQLPLRHYGPPIYAICDLWLEKLLKLGDENPVKENPENKNRQKKNELCIRVENSIKSLAAETTSFLPHQEKNQGKSPTGPFSTSLQADDVNDQAVKILTDAGSEDFISGFDRFRSRLEELIGQLKNYAKFSVEMYATLGQEIKEAKIRYAERISQEAKSNSEQLPSKSESFTLK